jgi:hypothetical protein
MTGGGFQDTPSQTATARRCGTPLRKKWHVESLTACGHGTYEFQACQGVLGRTNWYNLVQTGPSGETGRRNGIGGGGVLRAGPQWSINDVS